MPKVFVFGLDNAGKTVITQYLTQRNTSIQTKPTRAIEISKLAYKNIEFFMWDGPGQEKLRPSWKQGFEGSDVLLFVVDVSDPSRFALAKQVFESFLGDIRKLQKSLIVCLHKIDLIPGLDNIKTAKEILHIEKDCQRELFYLETTIKRPETIELIYYVMHLMISKEFQQGCTDGILDSIS